MGVAPPLINQPVLVSTQVPRYASYKRWTDALNPHGSYLIPLSHPLGTPAICLTVPNLPWLCPQHTPFVRLVDEATMYFFVEQFACLVCIPPIFSIVWWWINCPGCIKHLHANPDVCPHPNNNPRQYHILVTRGWPKTQAIRSDFDFGFHDLGF